MSFRSNLLMSVDVETLSYVNLQTMGAEAYTRDLRTRCLMFVYHLVGDPSPGTLWLEGDPPPASFVEHTLGGGRLTGWNVIGFDRLVFRRILTRQHGFPEIPDDAWHDSMHMAAAANLPRSLDGCATAVGLGFEANLKDNNRIRRITNAAKTAMPAPVRTILTCPERFDPKLVEDLQWLAARCVQDVVLEEANMARLPGWPQVRPWLHMPAIDRGINDRGVLMDRALVEGMANAAEYEKTRLSREIAKLTNHQVPAVTNIEKLKTWLIGCGVELPLKEEKKKPGHIDEGDAQILADDSEDESSEKESSYRLRKNDIADLLARTDVPEHCRLALAIRAEAAKSSVAKLNRMLTMAGPDDRLNGIFILGGGQQTLRFSSGGPQFHNLTRDVFGNPDEIALVNDIDDKNPANKQVIKRLGLVALNTAIEAGRTGDADLLRAMYEIPRKDAQGRVQIAGVMTWVSRMMRRTLAAPLGHALLNGDFAQVEARITAWLAQQTDVLETYRSGGDVYKLTAAGIYKIALELITKQMRQAGKVSILACGFGGGPHALLAMAYNYGMILSLAEATPIVKGWRESNAATVRYWYATDDAAANAVRYPGREFPVAPLGLVSYFMQDNCLCCRLPSERLLRYWAPRLHQDYWADGRPKERPSLTGIAIKGRAVFRRSLYHTILVENQVQGIGADLLGIGLENVDQQNIPIVLHVHDNIAAETPESRADRDLVIFREAMLDMPAWIGNLPMGVDAEYGARFG